MMFAAENTDYAPDGAVEISRIRRGTHACTSVRIAIAFEIPLLRGRTHYEAE